MPRWYLGMDALGRALYAKMGPVVFRSQFGDNWDTRRSIGCGHGFGDEWKFKPLKIGTLKKNFMHETYENV